MLKQSQLRRSELKVYRKTYISRASESKNEIIQTMKNPQIKKIAIDMNLHKKSMKDLEEERKYNMCLKAENKIKLVQINQRKYMSNHGKQFLIDFTDKERHMLKQYFVNLDTDNSGQIGIQELQDPFISMGIVSSTKEVKQILDAVDQSGNGQIEFDEFLQFIKKTSNITTNNVSSKFFKDFIQGKFSKDIPRSISFQMLVSILRRRNFLDAIISNDPVIKQQGMNVMKAYEKMLLSEKLNKKK